MGGNASGEESDNIDWDTEDELEIQNFPLSSCSTLTNPGGEAIVCAGEALENSPPQQKPVIDSDHSSSDYYENFLDEISDSDSWSEDEENTESLSDKEKTLLSLAKMGYTVEEASIAMDRCGAYLIICPDASIDEITDFLCAAQMAKAADYLLPDDEPKPKRKFFERELWKRKKQRRYEKRMMSEDSETIRLPKPMIGFGVPMESSQTFHRTLPEAAMGPPYFYYENVALAPKGVWDTIKRFLYDVEPEFVDSKYFCAAARKRGYVHNLPIDNRFPLLPLPPLTIHEALPLTRKWWPSWDTRTKLNCLQTCIGSAKLTDRIRKALEDWDGEPPLRVQKYVLDECRKWNLVWVGRNKLAPLEADEVEMLLGFPRNHTRGGGISRTDRYKSLGNSFQIDTVAYHLSVLKDLYPGGINLLSLFSGIGGAEVSLHRLGIPLKTVVSVEISEVNRNIVRGWWEQTNQKGNLIDFTDVQQLDGDRIEQLIHSVGGFDLVIGGSPCNNLAGSNRHHRDGLEGKESALFYDYFRILDLVKCIMGRQQ
ncbi:DNA (cytosine-5)-methyltransferase DRM2-like isoform X4 [Camellia sinensis]|uniref:DNA (cytosine-5)-methyltransferase DRM2-like isoform X4 n=1 Tax=Camellia sinensis TaxID=4442 RepID=UPI0010356699|nr:DNA (cytosine-5)-methyltransferase DRM2-like isoform X4 [Camellia sinensis]